MGAIGAEVRYAQALLSAQTGVALKADGTWGPQTELAFSKASPQIQREVRAMLARAGATPESVRSPKSIERQSPSIQKVMMADLKSDAKIVALAAARGGVKGRSLANLLANIDIESRFQPIAEDHRYNTAGLAQRTFSALRNMTASAVAILVKQGKSAFFEAAYGHTTAKGRELGNTEPGDGGKFFGRGYLQITGKSNYAAFDRAYPQYNVMTDPDVLIRDRQAAADAAVFFWMNNVESRGKGGDIRSASLVVNPAGLAMRERVASAEKYSTLV